VRAAAALALAAAAFGTYLIGCADTQVGVPEPFPGAGPGGGRWPPQQMSQSDARRRRTCKSTGHRAQRNADNYFGTKVADPYRWLENLDSPAVQEWVRKENALSQPALAALPQRLWLKRRQGQLWNY
jgi:hypothetical protein